MILAPVKLAYPSQIFDLLFLLFKGFVLWTILSFHFWNFLNRIFRVALLFICQGSACSCLTQLHYFIIRFEVCQELFWNIFYFSQPLLPQWVFILTRFFISVNMFSYLFLCSFGWAKKKNLDVAKISFLHFINKNGERGIWTLAPVTRPTPLAGAPLQPLEYFSSILNILYQYLIMRLSWRKIYYT